MRRLIFNKVLVVICLALLPLLLASFAPVSKTQYFLIQNSHTQEHQAKFTTGEKKAYQRGFRQGAASKLLYLPESHSDFVFSIDFDSPKLEKYIADVILNLVRKLYLF